jgi:hypothetical protein
MVLVGAGAGCWFHRGYRVTRCLAGIDGIDGATGFWGPIS